MIEVTRSRWVVTFAASLLALLTGCLFGSQTHTQHEGRRISSETLEAVHVGDSRDYVQALLGEPTKRTPVENGRQVWKWAYRTVKHSEGSVFLIVSSDSQTEEAGAVYVEFQNDLVTRTWSE